MDKGLGEPSLLERASLPACGARDPIRRYPSLEPGRRGGDESNSKCDSAGNFRARASFCRGIRMGPLDIHTDFTLHSHKEMLIVMTQLRLDQPFLFGFHADQLHSIQ